MSARSARAFLPALRSVERRLGVPVSRRVKILRELEFDLEELRRRLEEEGMTADDARAQALEALVPDRRTLDELDRLHASWYSRVTDAMSQEGVRRFERAALGLLALSLLIGSVVGLSRNDLLADPSPFIWPVLGFGVAMLATLAAQAFLALIKRDPSRAGEWGRATLTLAGLTLCLGAAGVLVDTYGFVATTGRPPSFFDADGIQWLIREAGLLAAALVLALAGALSWFCFDQWRALVSWAHRDVLGLDHVGNQ